MIFTGIKGDIFISWRIKILLVWISTDHVVLNTHFITCKGFLFHHGFSNNLCSKVYSAGLGIAGSSALCCPCFILIKWLKLAWTTFSCKILLTRSETSVMGLFLCYTKGNKRRVTLKPNKVKSAPENLFKSFWCF